MAVIATYNYNSGKIPITVTIEPNDKDFVLIYSISIASISKNTELLLDKIRDEVITKVGVNMDEMTDPKRSDYVKDRFKESIRYLLTRYVPDLNEKTKEFLITFLMQKSLGLGKIELLLDDIYLEEIAINNASEPVWVYHHKFGWLKTNITLDNEDQIKHYSSLIGRKVGRSITLLTPLLDARLDTGERINATLSPISTKGNTITIRKFNVKPITITNMIQEKTISLGAASLIWASVEYELSALVTGGTASGKCLTGDTKIILGNGEVRQIKDIVENELEDASFKASDGFYGIPSNLSVLSMNNEKKIIKSKVDYVWKKKSDHVLRILTRDGREIRTTEEHPFFTIEGGDIKEIRADKLEPGTRIACARKLPELDYNNCLDIVNELRDNKNLYVIINDVLKENEINVIKKNPKLKYRKALSLNELNKITKEQGLDFKEISHRIIHLTTKTNHKKKIYIPKEVSSELAEILGYIIGDGHINVNQGLISFTNIDLELRNKVSNNFLKVFNVESKEVVWKDKTPDRIVYSSALAELLNKYFNIPRGKKERIVETPKVLFGCHKNIIKYYLRALFDCEASVRENIEFSSASKGLVDQIKNLLMRYGMISYISKKFVKGKEYYRLMLYSEEAEKFKLISFNLRNKNKKLKLIKSKNHKNLDVIPNVSKLLKDLFSSSNLKRSDIATSSNVSPRLLRWYSGGGRNPTVNTLSKISCVLEQNSESALLDKLVSIINSDLYWDKVILIEKLKNEDEWVYDLTVKDSNFVINNGIIAHNTILLSNVCSFFQPNQRVISVEDSVTGDCEIIYKENNTFKKDKIGNLIDSIINKSHVELLDGTEISGNENDIEVFSMNDEGKINLAKPSSFIRHKTNKKIFEIRLSSGRKINVTGDHSLFNLNENKILEVKCSELKIGDFIATPRLIKYQGANKVFDLSLHLDKFKEFMVRGNPIKNIILKHGKELVKNKSSRRHYRINSIMPVSIFKEVLNEIGDEDKKLLELVPKRGNINGRRSLPLIIKIDEDISTLAGMWLADGCYDKKSIIISDPNEQSWDVVRKFAEKYNLSVKLHSDKVSAMINSKAWKVFFEEVLELKGDAYTKKVPVWVTDLDKKLVSKLLRGYFSGDGNVGHHELRVNSSSSQLLKDMQTLLLRFEIPLRISWNLGEDNIYGSRISGVKFLKIFEREINFIQEYKKRDLKILCNRKIHDVSDIVPLKKSSYLNLKNLVGDKLRKLLTKAYWNSWHISYRDKNIGRNYLSWLVKFIDVNNLFSLTITEEEAKEIINLANNDLFWDKISSIKETNYKGYVYDLSVPGNESFICNNIIAHNTRELVLPKYLHWIPMVTRESNIEGRGEISMLNLIVNSLRMRPDRIVVGEIRRQREAETLFEAMHTGHSVYATLHANDTEETINRLINPPINVPKTSLPAISMIIIMYRNRRTGIRRVFQISEIEKDSTAKVLMQYDLRSDKMNTIDKSSRLMPELQLQTGFTEQEINQNIKEKSLILSWLVKKNIDDVNEIGRVIATYYSDKQKLFNLMRK